MPVPMYAESSDGNSATSFQGLRRSRGGNTVSQPCCPRQLTYVCWSVGGLQPRILRYGLAAMFAARQVVLAPYNALPHLLLADPPSLDQA